MLSFKAAFHTDDTKKKLSAAAPALKGKIQTQDRSAVWQNHISFSFSQHTSWCSFEGSIHLLNLHFVVALELRPPQLERGRDCVFFNAELTAIQIHILHKLESAQLRELRLLRESLEHELLCLWRFAQRDKITVLEALSICPILECVLPGHNDCYQEVLEGVTCTGKCVLTGQFFIPAESARKCIY